MIFFVIIFHARIVYCEILLNEAYHTVVKIYLKKKKSMNTNGKQIKCKFKRITSYLEKNSEGATEVKIIWNFKTTTACSPR